MSDRPGASCLGSLMPARLRRQRLLSALAPNSSMVACNGSMPKHSSFRERMCESDEALDVGPREFNRKLIFPSHGIA